MASVRGGRSGLAGLLGVEVGWTTGTDRGRVQVSVCCSRMYVCMYCTVYVILSTANTQNKKASNALGVSECVSEKKRSWVDGMDGWMDGGGLWKLVHNLPAGCRSVSEYK